MIRARDPALGGTLLVAALLLAGCNGPAPAEAPSFDGEAALALVQEIVHLSDGSLRPRVPADPAHLGTADRLAGRMALPGWSVGVQDFDGATYLAHDHGAVRGYVTRCPAEDAEELPGLHFRNVLATYDAPGTDALLMLAAHWDAKENAEVDGREVDTPVPGANDGASGVAVLLQLMRHVSDGDLKPRTDLVVALFDGEDGFEDCHPLAGSIHYARTMGDAGGARPGRMLLLDMVGDPGARFVRESGGAASDPVLQDLLWAHGREIVNATVFTDVGRSVLDDHVPFLEEGVPAVDLIDFGRTDGRSGFPPYWHTPEDTPDQLTAGMLGAIGQVVWGLLEDPRLVETWPA